MANSFSDFVNRLFSSKVILKKMPSGRIKTVDLNRLQSVGNYTTGRFKGLRLNSNGQASFFGSGYSTDTQSAQLDVMRNLLYIDYELMDNDPILAGALDIYADEVTTRNAHGDVLTINCSNDKIKQILYNLHYEILNIEFNLWSWVRTLCKFGDLYLYTPTLPTVGVIDAIPIHPSLMNRRDDSGPNKDETKFLFEPANSQITYSLAKSSFDIQEIAHFRLLTNTNFLPYGKSMLEGARKVFKQLSMMEDAMLIHRIMRAPERRIFKIDVGNIAPEEVDGYMEEITNSMKKTPYVGDDGEYNLKYNLMNMLEDYYLPVRGGDTGTDISSLPGLTNEGQIDDIEYLRNKMMAFLKIPKSYMGYDGEGGKTTLPAEDVRFARTIERLQKMVTAELYKISVVHLMTQGYTGEELYEFSLTLSPPSMIYERQRVDLLNEKVNLISNIKEQKLLSNKYIYENILNLTPEEWKLEEDLIIEDLKLRFRQTQIEEEGNDPAVTGKSFGTPHDISALQVASKLSGTGENEKTFDISTDKRHDNEGRPEKPGSFERAKDSDLGYDPFGRKEMNRNEGMQRLIKALNKDIAKSIKTTPTHKDPDSGIEMLNESFLLD